MEPTGFFFIFLGIMDLVLAFGFIYYAFKNAFGLKGTISQYLIVTGALFFVITGVVSAISTLSSNTYFFARYIVFVVGFVFISVGEIYSGMNIRKIIGKKPWLTVVRTFSHSGYRSGGVLVILLFTIPLWALDIIIGPVSVYGIFASFFTFLSFILLIIGERKLYVATNVLSEGAISTDSEKIGLLKDDIVAVMMYTDIINTFVSFDKPATSALIVNDTLNRWSEEHPVLFEDSVIGNGRIDTSIVTRNLDRLYEKNRLSAALNEFSILAARLVNHYSDFTSYEYAKERLAESYQAVKKRYDTPVVFNILKTMPIGVLEDEKLAVLNRVELEEKAKEGTIELINANKKLRNEINGRKKTQRELQKSKHKIELQNIELKKLNHIKSEFLNVTSHELRTPMASIKGYIQMLLKETLGGITEEQKKALDVILRNTDRLDNLIQDILDISQIQSGTMKFIPEKMDVKTMVEETVETMQMFADHSGIKINFEIEDKLPELIVDQERVSQVIRNLMNNAVKFSPSESMVNVKAKRKKDDVLFEIEDFGRGIPKNKQKKIFDMFYQVDSGMDRKFGGVGLGLSLSRSIVLTHGGRMWVDSHVGEGSTFRFTLPVKPVENIEERFKEVDMFGLENK